ncbi:hypothetical protein C8R44DRAFT_347582 [Mycena epipterygia]|nr:hypothetical protein C8R44DRAFT_347582 [Mycena epipterygia]
MPATLSKMERSPVDVDQRQRNYAITCCGIVIVLQTMVPGTLYIITGDGQRRCIELKIDAADAGLTHQTKNVHATVRTLSIDGMPAQNEEATVTVQELGDLGEDVAESLLVSDPDRSEHQAEGIQADHATADVVDAVVLEDGRPQKPSALVATGDAPQANDHKTAALPRSSSSRPLPTSAGSSKPAPPHPNAASQVNKSPSVAATSRDSEPHIQVAERAIVLKDSTESSLSSINLSQSNESHDNAAAIPPLLPLTRSPAFRLSSTTSFPQLPVVPRRSPKKRHASAMDDEPSAVETGRSAGGGSRKRIKVGQQESSQDRKGSVDKPSTR